MNAPKSIYGQVITNWPSETWLREMVALETEGSLSPAQARDAQPRSRETSPQVVALARWANTSDPDLVGEPAEAVGG